MRIWADVYDSSGTTRLGEGPITSITSLSFTQALDGPGTFSMTVPGTDKRALILLTNKRWVKFWIDASVVGSPFRQVGEGIIESVKARHSGSGWDLTVTGLDPLSKLKNKNTLMNRAYAAQPTSTIAAALVGLAGFTLTGSGGNPTSMRFDGETALKALQNLMEQQGVHFRLASGTEIAYGAFGDISGYRAMNIKNANDDIYANDRLLVIDTFDIETDSQDIVNWIIPIGAGEGFAALTLQHSTRTTPYTIYTGTGPDGRNYWYLKDDTSIGLYGQIERVVPFKDVAPIAMTETDVIAAANVLYDTAAAYLQRYAQKLDVYSITVRKVRVTLKPGQKIRVRYQGTVTRNGELYGYRNIAQDMWLVEITENVNGSGNYQTLKVATVDRYEQSPAQRLVGGLEAIDARSRRINAVPSVSTFTRISDISATFPVVVPIMLSDQVLDLNRVAIRLKTSNREGSGTTPVQLSVAVDGIDRTGALGGYWALLGGNTTIDLDPELVTGYLMNAAGGMRQEHSVTVTCASGSGRVEAIVELAVTTQGNALI